MAQAQFPEPQDLVTDHFGDGTTPKVFSNYTLANPHPGFGKDPNILNEYGHTKYPMAIGDQIAHNAKEEAEIRNIAPAAELRQDGPTIQEYVEAKYPASTYPPKGFASKSTQEEIDAAIKAEATQGWGSNTGWSK